MGSSFITSHLLAASGAGVFPSCVQYIRVYTVRLPLRKGSTNEVVQCPNEGVPTASFGLVVLVRLVSLSCSRHFSFNIIRIAYYVHATVF